MKNLPDLAKHFKLLKIQMDLQGIDPEKGMFSMSLVLAARQGKIKQAIEMIREQGRANRPYMIEIIGDDLLTRIETL